MKSASYLIPLTLLTSLALTGCCGSGKRTQDSSLLYAPSAITLPAKSPVQTTKGLYRPENDEVWHSHKSYVELQERLMDALSALGQRDNRQS